MILVTIVFMGFMNRLFLVGGHHIILFLLQQAFWLLEPFHLSFILFFHNLLLNIVQLWPFHCYKLDISLGLYINAEFMGSFRALQEMETHPYNIFDFPTMCGPQDSVQLVFS